MTDMDIWEFGTDPEVLAFNWLLNNPIAILHDVYSWTKKAREILEWVFGMFFHHPLPFVPMQIRTLAPASGCPAILSNFGHSQGGG
jgi:hypothetical protein